MYCVEEISTKVSIHIFLIWLLSKWIYFKILKMYFKTVLEWMYLVTFHHCLCMHVQYECLFSSVTSVYVSAGLVCLHCETESNMTSGAPRPLLIVAPLDTDPPHPSPWCVCRTLSYFPPSILGYKQTSLRHSGHPASGLSAALCLPPPYRRSVICSGARCCLSLTIAAPTAMQLFSEHSLSVHPELSCWPQIWGTGSRSDY